MVSIRLIGLAALAALFATVSAQTVRLDAQTGVYELSDQASGWRLSGKIEGPIAKLRERDGTDEAGAFHEISFEHEGNRYTIQSYNKESNFRFRLEYRSPATKPIPFPNFTGVPADLKSFGYQDTTFSPGAFKLAQTSTPWLFFDRHNQAFIFSPASQFMVAKMVGDGQTSIGASLNDRLKEVPKGLRQDSILVFGQGINQTWNGWGRLLRAIYKRPAATPDADIVVKSFGYWTDNGADYYYNYDPSKGYPDTLLALRDLYRKEAIPLGYLQLDSWWYRKLSDSISGDKAPGLKNAKFPAQDWNRYGGVLEYRASKDLFPNGLPAFSKAFGLPFAVHGRWIDEQSPLRSTYKISGVAPVDPRYWSDVANYLASSGVTCYEQDWLDHIYGHSPEMPATVGVADEFADGMANSMRRKGITLQYCMPTPRFILQGVKYPNLTTVRTASDRFEPRKWAQFLFGSPFVEQIGAYPWCDVFRSRETANMILAVLSAGPVGTGDAMGAEQKENILRAARPDGVIVKPDRPLVPTDSTYQNEALGNGRPFLASTLTNHGGYRTLYFFAFRRQQDSPNFGIRIADYGIDHRCCLVDLETGTTQFVDPSNEVGLNLGQSAYRYLMAAPISKTGIVLLGDLGKFVPTGKQRIASVEDNADGLRVQLRFAKGEGPILLDGLCERTFNVKVVKGVLKLKRYDMPSRFTLEVAPGSDGTADIVIDGRG